MATRPNILWYCTDQQRFDTIAALGNPHVQTPTLDRLVTCLVAPWASDRAVLDVLPGPASIPIGFRDILGFNTDADGPESLGIIGIKFALFNGR